jgi:cell division protein FtsB
MTQQLELDLARRARATPRARAARIFGGLLQWTPVWIPLLFLAQLLVLGLRPVWATRARLDRAEAEVHARVEALRREERELAAEARMLGDEVYQERVRRSLIDPAAEPLTLERARAGKGP